MEYIDGPSGQERCLGSGLMIIIAYQAIGVEKTVFGAHFQGSRQVLLNTLEYYSRNILTPHKIIYGANFVFWGILLKSECQILNLRI